MILLELFFEFFKVGLFAVGGGPATIPFLQERQARLFLFSWGRLPLLIVGSFRCRTLNGCRIISYGVKRTRTETRSIRSVIGCCVKREWA